MTDYEAILKRIETTAINTCPGCGRPDVKWSQPVIVALPDVGGGTIKDEGPEAFAYACTNCGCIRLFSTQTFEP